MDDNKTYAPDEVLAHIIKDDDGNFRVKDLITGEIGEVCKFCDEGDKTIVLTPNSANRKWANRAKADAAIAEQGFFPMVYKATKHVGTGAVRVPNAKLIKFLPEDLLAEYNAIIERAKEAMLAAKAKPMTEREKLEARIKKAQEALAKLTAQEDGEVDENAPKKSKKSKN